MTKKYFILIVFVFTTHFLFAQQAKKVQKPKLVIGLVIDQMRWDYLYRYSDLYSSNGFKRLINNGFSCDNTLVPYVPTYTGPGHTCIYTGSVPAIHGIVANDWYDSTTKKNVYCTDDSSVSTIGSSSNEGKMSPRNLWTTTVGDELRLSTNFKSKVIGIALKDRAAILPGGHAANAAYWYDDNNGKWISSSYYINQLPEWVIKENEKLLPDAMMSKDWNTLLPLEKYIQSTKDDEDYEGRLPEEKTATFPHHLSQIGKAKYSAFKFTPFAATFTFDMAKAAIENEKLGKNDVTDFLAISISSTDYMGHTFGPNSIEAEDTYLRLDRDIANFLNYLDATLGRGNYVLFLTADHGVVRIPGFLEEHNIPGGTYKEGALFDKLKSRIFDFFGLKNAVVKIQNNQVYLNYEEIKKAGKKPEEVENEVVRFLNEQPFIDYAFVNKNIESSTIASPIKTMLINGYNPKRSGQIGFIQKPGYIDGGKRGTTHGAWNPYDAHIPLIWFGTNINHGKTNRETYMTDIAPTVAAMLNIQMPSGSVGKVIEEVVK